MNSTGPCCAAMHWKHTADFGHVAGFDLDLGRCTSCGAYVMYVWYYEDRSDYVVVPTELAEHFLAIAESPQFRAELRTWVDP